jgi:hypothetical protein
MGNQARHCRQVPVSGFSSGHVIAIFDHPEDYCAPVFKTAEAANDSVCTSKLMYIPIYTQQSKLLFSFQVELKPDFCRAVVEEKIHQTIAETYQFEASPKERTEPLLGRKKSKVMLQWRRSDFGVFKALSMFAGARFEIFIDRLIFQKKI